MQFYWGDIPSTVHSEWDLPKKVIVFYIVKLSKKFFLYLCDREKKRIALPDFIGGGQFADLQQVANTINENTNQLIKTL